MMDLNFPVREVFNGGIQQVQAVELPPSETLHALLGLCHDHENAWMNLYDYIQIQPDNASAEYLHRSRIIWPYLKRTHGTGSSNKERNPNKLVAQSTPRFPYTKCVN